MMATGSILHMHRGQIGSASAADLSITLSLQQNKHVPASPQMVPPILNCHFQAKPTWMAGPEAPAISLGRSSDAFHLPAWEDLSFSICSAATIPAGADIVASLAPAAEAPDTLRWSLGRLTATGLSRARCGRHRRGRWRGDR